MQAWNVCLNGKNIDTVFFAKSFAAADVRDALINHDGCDHQIAVRRNNLVRIG